VKADSSNLECLKVILDGVLHYLKTQSQLADAESVILADVDFTAALQNF
jgi:hypothetical protein